MTSQRAEPGTPRSLAAALAAFQGAMPVVAKTKTAHLRGKDGQPTYSYSYAGLAEVSAAASPLLAEHGLSFTCTPAIDEQGRITLLGILQHTSGDQLTGQLPISGSTPQQVGSALTYARRYLLGCMTGIVTDDDDDGAMASQKRPRKAASPPVAPGPTQTVRRRPPAGRPVQDVPLEASSWDEQPPGVTAAPVTPDPGQLPHAPQVAPTDSELNPSLRGSLMAATSRLGIDPSLERDTRLALWSALLARHITTGNELTRTEALTLLRRMNDCETGAVEWTYSVETGAVTLRHMDREPGT